MHTIYEKNDKTLFVLYMVYRFKQLQIIGIINGCPAKSFE